MVGTNSVCNDINGAHICVPQLVLLSLAIDVTYAFLVQKHNDSLIKCKIYHEQDAGSLLGRRHQTMSIYQPSLARIRPEP